MELIPSEDYTKHTVQKEELHDEDDLIELGAINQPFTDAVAKEFRRYITKDATKGSRPFTSLKAWFVKAMPHFTHKCQNFDVLCQWIVCSSIYVVDFDPPAYEHGQQHVKIPELIQEIIIPAIMTKPKGKHRAEITDDHQYDPDVNQHNEQQPGQSHANSTTSSAQQMSSLAGISAITDMFSAIHTQLQCSAEINKEMLSTLKLLKEDKGQPSTSSSTHTRTKLERLLQDPAADNEEEPTQASINAEVLKVLQTMSKTDKPLHHIHPPHILKRTLELHKGGEDGSWAQRAACRSAKALLHMYELGHPMGPTDPHGPIAQELTSSINDSLASDAFPSTFQQQKKEKTQLLKAAWGGDLDTKEAYSSWRGRGRGRGGWRGGRWQDRGGRGRGGRGRDNWGGRGGGEPYKDPKQG